MFNESKRHILVFIQYGSFFNITLTLECNLDPWSPSLISTTGDYKGIHYFLIFTLKQRLFALPRTTSIDSPQANFNQNKKKKKRLSKADPNFEMYCNF